MARRRWRRMLAAALVVDAGAAELAAALVVDAGVAVLAAEAGAVELARRRWLWALVADAGAAGCRRRDGDRTGG